MASDRVAGIVERITSRQPGRTEADLQSHIRELLSSGALDLGENDVIKLEVPMGAGTRRRLDIELGNCCIEVKKDLRPAGVLRDAQQQLAGYVKTRAQEVGQRYVGLITDGVQWHLHRLNEVGDLAEVAHHTAHKSNPEGLLTWLESILATDQDLAVSPANIRERLGADSPAHRLDHDSLRELYDTHGHIPEVQVKKELWARLLRTAFGSGFADSTALFVDHTLLVLTAEAIAHAVLGWDLRAGGLSARDIASGTQFHNAQIYGVVEEDFFDWVLSVPGGDSFVTNLARRVSRFDWASSIGHDVLKALYTSVLPSEAREALGEYYTPDWLAYRMVQDAYTDPADQRLLEPSCGSGTFLLHAVRAHLDAVETAGATAGQAIVSTLDHVIGMDVHPVSVILARVTYLMAIGRDRLNDPTRGAMSIPVYLGDSVQWEQRTDLLAGVKEITISTHGDDLVSGGGGALFGDDLRFPLTVLGDANNFDRLVSVMADKAITETRDARDVMRPILRGAGVHDPEDGQVLTATFETMRNLHNTGRDHIWGYYVRNLIRPLWLADKRNRVDVLIGNPPWLRYSKMTQSMQGRYLTLAKERQLLSGKAGASARDLSTLFVSRAVELYLRDGGRFAFVMPHGVLSRRPHAGFRTGDWSSKGTVAAVDFDTPWDLSKTTTGFPMTACVVRGARAPSPGLMTSDVVTWTGRLNNPDQSWEAVKGHITEEAGVVATVGAAATSPYAHAFRQGAILVPRYLLFVVEPTVRNPLGTGAGRVQVTSRRTNQEKDPWRKMTSLSGTVEKRFVRDVHLGETIAPFRSLPPLRAVLPLGAKSILTNAQVEDAPGLAEWWSEIEAAWATGRKPSEQKPLLERFNYHEQLSAQLPTASHRVVYSKAGNSLAAARLTGTDAVVDHKLYWAATASKEEALYLVAILNAPVTTKAVSAYQSQGLFGGRDFDKYVWQLPIPTFDPSNATHTLLARLGETAERDAASCEVPSGIDFQTARKHIRANLDESGVTAQLNALVTTLLGLETLVDAIPDPHVALKAQAIRDGSVLIRLTDSDATLDVVDIAVDLDCEFDDTGVALWGATVTTGGESVYHAFGSPNGDENEHATALLAWLQSLINQASQEGKKLRIYHYGSTEPANLRRIVGPKKAAPVTANMTDLLATLREHFFAPDGFGLKHLAGRLGATWRTPSATGETARTWVSQARSGDQNAWDSLLAYNEDDTHATQLLRSILKLM